MLKFQIGRHWIDEKVREVTIFFHLCLQTYTVRPVNINTVDSDYPVEFIFQIITNLLHLDFCTYF